MCGITCFTALIMLSPNQVNNGAEIGSEIIGFDYATAQDIADAVNTLPTGRVRAAPGAWLWSR